VPQVVAYDFGIKHNILRRLTSAGCRVTVVPAAHAAEDVLAMKPDGIFLSNGPVRLTTNGVPVCFSMQIAVVRHGDMVRPPAVSAPNFGSACQTGAEPALSAPKISLVNVWLPILGNQPVCLHNSQIIFPKDIPSPLDWNCCLKQYCAISFETVNLSGTVSI